MNLEIAGKFVAHFGPKTAATALDKVRTFISHSSRPSLHAAAEARELRNCFPATNTALTAFYLRSSS